MSDDTNGIKNWWNSNEFSIFCLVAVIKIENTPVDSSAVLV